MQYRGQKWRGRIRTSENSSITSGITFQVCCLKRSAFGRSSCLVPSANSQLPLRACCPLLYLAVLPGHCDALKAGIHNYQKRMTLAHQPLRAVICVAVIIINNCEHGIWCAAPSMFESQWHFINWVLTVFTLIAAIT